MRTCEKCGFEGNQDAAIFCARCGAPLGDAAPPPTEDTATPPGNQVQFTGETVKTDRRTSPSTGSSSATWDSRALLPEGSILQERYRVVRVLGKGGMGAVYLVEDLKLYGKQWALKELLEHFMDPAERAEAIEMFQHEVQILVSLRHPNLPQVANAFESAGRHYLVMEYIEGQTLEKLIKAAPNGRLPEKHVLAWAAQICDVLDYLHSHEPPVIFRDIKPANIMITPRGQVKLIDFGVARLFDPNKGTDTLRMGTVGYAPPEQYSGQGQTTPRSDIYALGATLYELLSGDSPEAHPFVFTPLHQLNRQVSAHVAHAVDEAVQLDPNNRFPSARAMRAALLEKRRRPLLAILLGLPLLALLLALAAGGWWLWRNGLPGAARITPTARQVAAQATSSPTSTPTRPPTSTPVPTSTPTSTPTPDLTATAIAACVFDLEIVTDKPVWPGVLVPGQQFTKKWEIKNAGTCPWPEGVEMAFKSGAELTVVETPTVESLAPDESAEIELVLKAPVNFGSYASVWQLQDSAENPIGAELEVACRVGPTPTPRATATPLPTPTPEFTIGPLGFSVPTLVEWDKSVEGEWWGTAVFDVWGGDGNYHYYVDGVELSEPQIPVRAQKCKSWGPHTIVVQSGDGQESTWAGSIPYPEQDKCK